MSNAQRLSGNDRRRVAENPHDELRAAVSVSRFWRLVDMGGMDECWPFRGYRDRAGYGIFTDENGRRLGAHEAALSYTTGEKRHPSLETCHSCDNPPCCNPNHLRFDTRQSNVQDMIDRDRHKRGSQISKRLTESDVVLMRERRALGARHKDLASDFGVTIAAVTAIVHGRNWKHVGGPVTNRHISRTKSAQEKTNV